MSEVDVGRDVPTVLSGRATVVTVGLFAATLLAGALLGAAFALSGAAILGWVAAGGTVHLAAASMLYRNLGENRRSAATAVLPGLGEANVLTLVRGTLFAWVGGTAALAATGTLPGPLQWLPAGAYGAGALLDAVDGALARAADRVTLLGSHLDGEFDGLGIVVAAAAGVATGSVPLWYLAVGVVKYVYVAALAVRRRRGGSVGRLPDSDLRRVFAGLQMAYLFVALLPVTGRSVAAVAGLAVGTPYVAGFVRDWLAVTGRTRTGVP